MLSVRGSNRLFMKRVDEGCLSQCDLRELKDDKRRFEMHLKEFLASEKNRRTGRV